MNNLFRSARFASLFLGGVMACAPLTAKAVDFDDTGVFGDIKYGIVGTIADYKAYVIEFDMWEDDDMEYTGDIVIPETIELDNGEEATVVGIDDRAFYSSGVTSVTMPNTIRTIGKQAFGLCGNLTYVKIGTGIEEIGSKAFFPDAKLTTMYVDALTPPTIAADALMNAPQTMTLYVPTEAVDAYKAADTWNKIGNILSQDDVVSVTKIEVSPAKANVSESSRLQLTATVYPADAQQKVAWSSSNPKIASVSVNGEVYGNKSGICTIYAAATDGSGVRGECVVTVGSGKILEVSQPYISGYVDETRSIIATVSPDDTTVEWNVADPEIASINPDGFSAIVRLLKVGNTVVTVTASNGLSKEIEVNVLEKVELTGIEVSPSTLELEVGDSFYMYEFDVTPVPENVSVFNPDFYIEDTRIVDYDEEDIDEETFICLAPGTTRLVWKQGDIEGYCTIIVNGDAEVLLTDIVLDPTSVAEILKPGDTFQITATPVPADATDFNPVWSSSNDSVATVDSTGNVTVLSIEEDVIITCTSGSIKAECPVYLKTVGVESVSEQVTLRIVAIDGSVLYEAATTAELENLLPGLYIVNGKKYMKQ